MQCPNRRAAITFVFQSKYLPKTLNLGSKRGFFRPRFNWKIEGAIARAY
ncbi:hypothetical protein [Tychonema sp. LEGE 07203]|nr:hypothetical protein [Tychonema sp. LEGE 07203]MBE9093577.1 hypothetical protein [Tychonema sp. LEGE 07203]